MKASSILRSASLFAALGAALTSHAAVRYGYHDGFTSLVVTTPNFITATQSFSPFNVDSANIFLSSFSGATFSVKAGSPDALTIDYSFLGFLPGTFTSSFEEGSFGKYGTFTALDGASEISGTLTVSKVDAVPEPASLAALAVGAAGLLRRRKRA